MWHIAIEILSYVFYEKFITMIMSTNDQSSFQIPNTFKNKFHYILVTQKTKMTTEISAKEHVGV